MLDRETLRNLLLAGGVFVLLMAVIPRLMPPPPTPDDGAPARRDPSTAASASHDQPGPPKSAVQPVIDVPAGQPSARVSASETFHVVEAAEEVTRIMGSRGEVADPAIKTSSPYRMRLTLSNVGASIESATASDHAEDLSSHERYRLLSMINSEDGARYRSLAVEGVTIDGTNVPLHDRRWSAGPLTETETGQTVEFQIEIHRDRSPVLELIKFGIYSYFIEKMNDSQSAGNLKEDASKLY